MNPEDPGPEFDSLAKDYDQHTNNFFKRLLGGSGSVFIERKAKLLINELKHRYSEKELNKRRILDFGCGTGTLLSQLKIHGYPGYLEGCDTSSKMIEQARNRLPFLPPESLWNIDESSQKEETYDAMVCSAVLHHVQPDDRKALAHKIVSWLKAGGLFVVFEHNPFNPMTRFMVARSPLDQNAVLLSPNEVLSLFTEAGLERQLTRHFFFLPPRLPFSETFDAFLSWLPIGGQYAIIFKKPE